MQLKIGPLFECEANLCLCETACTLMLHPAYHLGNAKPLQLFIIARQ